MDNKIIYLGHSTFKIITSKNRVILIDPWVMNNPVCPESLKKFEKIDIMLITHGHFDHMGDAIQIAKDYYPTIVCIFEIALYLQSKQVGKIRDMNKGGSLIIDDIKITMVQAQHSSAIVEGNNMIYGGEPVGYVIRLEDGFTIYHTGDTNVFSDMKIFGDVYKPDLCMLPIGDLYTMSAKEAAYAIKLLKCRKVIPMHYGTFPALIGSPDELKRYLSDLKDIEIIDLKPGESY